MAWSGVTSMGYGAITLAKQGEIWLGIVIIFVQIVFCARARRTRSRSARGAASRARLACRARSHPSPPSARV
jgi:hypothetical protein